PRIADWCVVGIADSDGRLRRLVYAEAAKSAAARQLEGHLAADVGVETALAQVIRTGRPALHLTVGVSGGGPGAPPIAGTESEAPVARELGVSSAICVALPPAHGIEGAVAFISADPARLYGWADVAIARVATHLLSRAMERSRVHEAERNARDLAEAQSAVAQAANRAKDEF